MACGVVNGERLCTGKDAVDDATGAAKGEVEEAECDEALRGFAFTALENHDEGILEQLQPLYVIMYDPDISFVRQLEVSPAALVHLDLG